MNPYIKFLSTPSARRATTKAVFVKSTKLNFYPRPPRGGRPITAATTRRPRNFYPRPPRGGRLSGQSAPIMQGLFLSTPSARRATGMRTKLLLNAAYFYPRPPRGGRLEDVIGVDSGRGISIHALREEGDCVPYRDLIIAQKFLSTPSARRATKDNLTPR